MSKSDFFQESNDNRFELLSEAIYYTTKNNNIYSRLSPVEGNSTACLQSETIRCSLALTVLT